jgi:RNA polymerase sigma factor (sigma-70 family)
MRTAGSNDGEIRRVLGNVMNQHGMKWLKFVFRMLGNQADAEDVVQEAARRVLMCGHPLPSEEQMRMYLSRAICNLAIESYKRRKRERGKQIQIQEDRRAAAHERTPYLQLAEKEECAEKIYLLQIMHKGLSTLPVKQYEALRMTYLEENDPSIRDCSQASGIPYSTLRHRTLQGLRSLRRFIHRALRTSRLFHFLE